MKNYEDSKCGYGYITLCTECVERLKELRKRSKFLPVDPHINLDREVKGFPTPECEHCKKKEV